MRRLPRLKQLIYMIYDLAAINLALFLAYFFRFGKTVFRNLGPDYLQNALLTTLIFFLFYHLFLMYQRVWYHAGLHDHFFGILANVSAGLVLLAIEVVLDDIFLPLVILTTILATMLTLGGRMVYRLLRYTQIHWKRRGLTQQRTLIVGGGSGGDVAIKEMQGSLAHAMRPVAVVDDNRSYVGRSISGVPIVGVTRDIPDIVEQYAVDLILIAIPSLSEQRKREIYHLCRKAGRPVRSMLGIEAYQPEAALVHNIRDVNTEALLGKPDLHVDEAQLSTFYAGSTIMIAGAAGAMGSTLARQLVSYQPKTLILVDFSDSGLISLNQRLQASRGSTTVLPLTASLKDEAAVQRILMAHRPQFIFDCAFHNHEDLISDSPAEVIRNNLYATGHLVKSADRYGVKQYIMLSSDEAARPNTLISASKRIAEMIVQGFGQTANTHYLAVRFPSLNENAFYYLNRFKRELARGGPLTLEHQGMTRLFASRQDAVKLILEAARISRGGEIFSLDLGQPRKLLNLAYGYAELAGLAIDRDIELKITGTISDDAIEQPIHESVDHLNATDHPQIFAARSQFDNYAELNRRLNELRLYLDQADDDVIRYQVLKTVKDLIPNFYGMSFDESGYAGLDLSPSGGSRRIWLSSPHLGGLERHYVIEALETNWVAPLGPNVNAFEKELGDYVRIKAAAAMSSGTAAIHIALRLLGVQSGDAVFCSSLTFAGSCNPILYEKAIPVFIDSEPESWNMSPLALEKAFIEFDQRGEKPKAVIVVNLYGQSADYDRIQAICSRYDVPILEDAAESLGATYKNRQTGTFGRFGTFSFNGNKIITSSGGGMLVSQNEAAIEKAKFVITQARDQARHYQHSEVGFNYRMSNVSAGIGRGQLKVLEMRINRKKAIYQFYKTAFSAIPEIQMMPVAAYGEPNYWLSVMTIDPQSPVKPLDIMLALEADEIESRPVWKPMHLQPLYANYPFYSHLDDEHSISEDLFNRGVCLPSDTKMTEADLERVTGHIKGVFNQATQQPS